jgi:hypothetical protein
MKQGDLAGMWASWQRLQGSEQLRSMQVQQYLMFAAGFMGAVLPPHACFPGMQQQRRSTPCWCCTWWPLLACFSSAALWGDTGTTRVLAILTDPQDLTLN